MKHLFLSSTLLFTLFVNAQLTDLPVTLSLPFDGDTIEESEPVFIWQCNLAALQTDPRLSQRLTVVQLQEGQTPLEGLTVNTPVFIRENLTTSTLPYSSMDHELIENTWYAWQVSYLMNNMVIGQSEAWKFIRTKPEVPGPVYIQLRKHPDLSYYTLNEPAVYFTSEGDGIVELKAKIKDEKGREYQLNLTELSNDEPVASDFQPGSRRFFKADLKDLDLKNGEYTLYWLMTPRKTKVIHLRLQK